MREPLVQLWPRAEPGPAPLALMPRLPLGVPRTNGLPVYVHRYGCAAPPGSATTRVPAAFDGWALLCLGWAGILGMLKGDMEWGVLGWFANPCFLVATVALVGRLYRIAIAAGAIAIAFALTSLQLPKIRFGALFPSGPVDGYGPGFFLWLSAMGLSFAFPLLYHFGTRGARPESHEAQVPPIQDNRGKEDVQPL